jgi:hypothetical protein
MSSAKRESVHVLEECIELQLKKSRDYQNEKSNILQAMHYRRGVSTIHDMISQKLLRAQSLLETYENGDSSEPNFEGLEDTYKDLINYASFAVSYIRGKMEGQDINRDMINRPVPLEAEMTREEYDRAVDARDDPLNGVRASYIKFDDTILMNNNIVENEVEEDGFTTEYESGTGWINRVAASYTKEVANVGPITIPHGEINCTDSLQHTCVQKINPNIIDRIEVAGSPSDIGDRYEEDIKEHLERIECREQQSKTSGRTSRRNSRNRTS